MARLRSGTTATNASSSLSGSGACTHAPSTVVAATSPPNTLAAAFSGCPSYAAATAKRIVGAGGGRGGGGEGGGGAEAPGHRDLRAHRDRDAVVTEDLGDHPGRQVGRVVEEARPLALAAHAQ